MIKVVCSDPYYAYDAYHITAAFYPADVVAGNMSQRLDETSPSLVSIRQDGQELFCYPCGEAHRCPERKEDKIRMGQALYETLCSLNRTELPWGLLTGIRPTKIVRRMLEQGILPAVCEQRFRERYRVSEQKARLAVEIAARELTYLQQAKAHAHQALLDGCADSDDGLCVYVHIPFCPSRCRYCSFASVPSDRYADRMDPYLDALEKEMRSIGRLTRGRPVTTVYVGGGTPTSLSADQLKRLCDLLIEVFGRPVPGDTQPTSAAWLEWTVEAGRPDTMTEAKLRVLQETGVTRLSVNPQTMHDETLARIGRRHTVAEIRSAVSMARDIGFETINMDLIAGLEGEHPADFEQTLHRLQELHPDHVTVHALAIKRASAIGQEHSGHPADAGEVNEMTDAACVWARTQGLEPYYLYRQKNMSGNGENIGYAPPGKGSYYNILIMEEAEDILAFGAGAVSKFVTDGATPTITRVENVKDVSLYIRDVEDMIKRKERVLC